MFVMSREQVLPQQQVIILKNDLRLVGLLLGSWGNLASTAGTSSFPKMPSFSKGSEAQGKLKGALSWGPRTFGAAVKI